MKYSSGPWEVSKTPPLDPTVCFSIKSIENAQGNSALIAQIVKTGSHIRPNDGWGNPYWIVDNNLDNQTTLANATLIAAAPKMLEVLQAALDWCKSDVLNEDGYPVQAMFDARIEILKAVITKATGEQK